MSGPVDLEQCNTTGYYMIPDQFMDPCFSQGSKLPLILTQKPFCLFNHHEDLTEESVLQPLQEIHPRREGKLIVRHIGVQVGVAHEQEGVERGPIRVLCNDRSSELVAKYC